MPRTRSSRRSVISDIVSGLQCAATTEGLRQHAAQQLRRPPDQVMVILTMRSATTQPTAGAWGTVMGRGGMAQLSIVGALVVWLGLTSAQGSVASGLYEITSGSYTECCGIAGELTVPLPNESQRFVWLTVDPQTGLASMSFLGRDRQTVFSIVPCLSTGSIQFALNYGFCYSNSILFLADPGPPPYSIYWHYDVTNSADSLQINGLLGMAMQGCVDVPTQFGHSNVVARLVPGPTLSVAEYSKQGALLHVQGHAAWTNVIEASEDLLSWTAISTNLMPTAGCPTCSSIVFRDTASTNLASRFYRCFER
jgi:hypothetical protein